MELLSKKQVQARFGDTTARTVERLVQRGRIPAPIYVNGRAYWESSDIDLAFQLMLEEKRRPWLKINRVKR